MWINLAFKAIIQAVEGKFIIDIKKISIQTIIISKEQLIKGAFQVGFFIKFESGLKVSGGSSGGRIENPYKVTIKNKLAWSAKLSFDWKQLLAHSQTKKKYEKFQGVSPEDCKHVGKLVVFISFQGNLWYVDIDEKIGGQHRGIREANVSKQSLECDGAIKKRINSIDADKVEFGSKTPRIWFPAHPRVTVIKIK